MYHIVLECELMDVPAGPQAATEIAEEFMHRPWHQNVTCTWNGKTLRLEADNDYDANGLALSDEFSDAITACVVDACYSNLRVVSVTEAS
jgi:hypothetical protein